MKQTVTESIFIDSFPESYKDNFSYEGKKALFEYLEELDRCSNETEIELDPIAFCCEYSEYESAMDCVESCSYQDDIEWSGDDDGCDAMQWLNDSTTVIEFDGGIIIQDF